MSARRLLPALAMLPTLAAASPAPGAFALAGGHAFNASAPERARCAALDATRAAALRACRYAPSGAAGLDVPYHECRDAAGRQIIVVPSARACHETLETMRAHAP